MKPAITTETYKGVVYTLMRLDPEEGNNPCGRCAFSKDQPGCSHMSPACGETGDFWFVLTTIPPKSFEFEGKRYHTVPEKDGGGCDGCVAQPSLRKCVEMRDIQHLTTGKRYCDGTIIEIVPN